MQHLNLYSQLDRQVEPPLSARQQMRLLGAIAAVMIAIYLVLLLGTSHTDAELKAVSAQQKAVGQELARRQAEKARLENTPELDRDIVRLQRNLEFRHRLLSTIRPEGEPSSKGFAEHLAGLARQHIDGLWFTEIELRQGGRQMALLGQTKQPEYVPRYLQKLSQEAVFAGHHFSVLRMYVPEDRRNLHSFELRAKEVGQP